MLSSRAVDSHRMYCGGSVVGKVSTIGIEAYHTPPLIFTGGQKVRNLAYNSFHHHSTLSRSQLKKIARYPNAETKFLCVGMIALCLHQVWRSWVHATLRTVCQSCPTPEIARRKRAKSSITQRWITRFRSNFVQTLIT